MRRGINVLTAQQAGRCRMADPDQLAFATAQERVMVTFDVDFLALHQSGVKHAGIAWCQEQKYNVGELVQALQLLFAVLDRDLMGNHVEHL